MILPINTPFLKLSIIYTFLLVCILPNAFGFYNDNLEYKELTKLTDLDDAMTPPVNVIAANVYTEGNTTISVPFTVENFNNIVTSQFSVHWNPAVSTYITSANFAFNIITDRTPIGCKMVDEFFNPLAFEKTDSLVAIDFNNVNISGTIQRYNEDLIGGVQVIANGDVNATLFSNVDGEYIISDIPAGSNITIIPQADGSIRRCLSTYDLALLLAHKDGILLFDSPYQIIAADVNDSHSISTFDLVLLRKIILNIEDELPFDTPWRFVDADYAFPNLNNPFQESFPEMISINNIQQNEQANFVALKVGDVSNCEEILLPPQMTVIANTKHTVLNNDVTIDISAENFTNLIGTQFSIQWDTTILQFNEIDLTNSTLADLYGSNFNGFTDNGTLNFSWLDNDLQGESLADETILFSLKFTAIADNSYSPISFVENPVSFEAIDYNFNVYSLNHIDGQVTIDTNPKFVSGNIQRENGLGIADVEVLLSGDFENTQLTNMDGIYSIDNIPTGSNITLTPQKDGDDINCVSVYDLLLTRAHIIAHQNLDSPYQKIAADANNSQTITTFDIEKTRELIFNNIATFNPLPSWRFIDANYTFPSPHNPWVETFPETVSIDNIMTNIETDFIAIKTGDVSNCEEVILAPQTNLILNSIAVNNGENFVARVKVENFTNLVGAQFSIEWNPEVLEFISLINFNSNFIDLTTDDFNVNANSGVLSCAWINDNIEGITLADGEVFFEIVFMPRTDDVITPINFVETPTKFEAVDKFFNVYGLNHIDGQVTIGSPLPTVYFSSLNTQVYEGGEICMDVFMDNIVDIVAVQMSLEWDVNILNYSHTQGYNLPDMDHSSFGTANASNGSIVMSWLEDHLTGVTLPPTSIFQVCFDVVGTEGEVSNFDLVNNPELIQVFNENEQELPYQILQNATIEVIAPNLTVPELTPVNEGTYEAITITSQGIVEANSLVEYVACDCILLEGGFEVELGAEFTAFIEDCPPQNLEKNNIVALPKEAINMDFFYHKNVELQLKPNPVQDVAFIQMDLPTAGYVQMEVRDFSGKKISILSQNNWREAGSHYLTFQMNNWLDGVYYLILSFNHKIYTEKIVLIK